MPLNFDDLQRRYETARLPNRRPDLDRKRAPKDDDLSLAGAVGDVLAAPLRGVEGAVRGVYNLGDALLADALPDWETRVFGESRTLVGGFVEAATQFAAGFVPVYGWLGRAASAGRFIASPIVRGAAAGAVADFAVFDGHDQRLANFIERFPSLQNPVTEFLASDPDDPEIVGRLKNVLEGLGLGAITDGFIHGLKWLSVARRERAAGKSAQEVLEAADKAAPPEEINKALTAAGDVTQPSRPEPAPTQPGGSSAALEAPEAEAPVPKPGPLSDSPETAAEVLRTFDLDDDQIAAILGRKRARTVRGQDPAVTPRRLSPQERAAQQLESTDLNLKHYQGTDGALQYIRAIEQVLEPLQGNKGAIGRMSLNEQETEALEELAEILGEGGPEGTHRLMASLQKDAADLPALNRRVLAYKTAFNTYAHHVEKMAIDLANPAKATDLSRLEFKQALGTLAEMELAVKSLLGEQGRGLGANRLQTVVLDDVALDATALRELLDEAGSAAQIDDLAAKFRMAVSTGGAAAATDIARASLGKRAWGLFNSYWYHALLGRPTTLVVNAASGAITSVYRPLELLIGGAATANSEVIHQGFRELANLWDAVPEAMRAAKAAWENGGNLLDPRHQIQDVGLPAPAVGSDVAQEGVSWFTKWLQWPSRALLTTDEAIKQLNYRSVAKSHLQADALRKGLKGEEAGRYVSDRLSTLTWEDQAYGSAQLFNQGVQDALKKGIKSKAGVRTHAREYALAKMADPEHRRLTQIATLAIDRAQEVTFTKPLRRGSLSWKVQQAVRQHPLLRLVMPFVRTPVNLATFSLQRLDAPGAVRAYAAHRIPAYAQALEASKNRLVQDALSGDAARIADATGRLTAGMSVTSFILLKASEASKDGLPLITGFGPRDKEQRDILTQAGWQPYSIRVGDRYVSYARFDPFASLIGTAADVVNFAKYAAEEDQETVSTLSYGLATALAHNFTNKTYLTGLANFMEALSDPQRQVPRLVRTLGGSLIPGEFAATVNVTDPVVRDVRNIFDAWAARIPGLSDNLPAVRNVLGEPVRRARALGSGAASVAGAFVPILYRDVSDDTIYKELQTLSHGFTPPRRVRHGLDLGTVSNSAGRNAYDRWSELHGEVKVRGKSMRETLRRLIRSKRYQRLTPESTDEQESPRIRLIRGVINDFRYRAWEQTLKEFPDLAAIERQRVQNQRRLLAGQQADDRTTLGQAGLSR